MTALAEKPPVILLGGNHNALSVARRLAPIGVEVYILGTSATSALSSRHVRGIVFPASSDPANDWLRWLMDPTTALDGAILLPGSDDGITLLAQHGEQLRQRYRLIEGRADVLLGLLDKVTSYDLAQSAGVPTPKYRAVRNVDDAIAAAEWIGYPCALKPRLGHVFRRSFANTKLFVVADRSALETVFSKAQMQGLEMLMTEIVPGSEDAYASCFTYLDDKLQPLFVLTKRKIRQNPPGFGLGTYHATDWNPEVADLGLRFLRGCGLAGYANVEFKRDPRDGQFKLIECNARFTLNHELLEVAGIPAAQIVYARLASLPLPAVQGYRRNVRVLLPLDDLRAFRALRRRGEITAWQWVRSLLHPPHFLVFRWTDPGPWLHTLRQYWGRKFSR